MHWLVEASVSEKRADSTYRAENGDNILLQNNGFYQPVHMVH
jgi:hypothetical protein